MDLPSQLRMTPLHGSTSRKKVNEIVFKKEDYTETMNRSLKLNKEFLDKTSKEDLEKILDKYERI
jgi:hypothetical protein